MNRRCLLLLAAACMPICGAFGQGPDYPNEGARLEFDSTNAIHRFSWWSRMGHTYFLQHSEDLATWL